MDREFRRLAVQLQGSDQHSLDVSAFFEEHIHGYRSLSQRMLGLRADLISIPSAWHRAHARADFIVRFTWDQHWTDWRIPNSHVRRMCKYFTEKGEAGIPRWLGEAVAGDRNQNDGVRALGAAVASNARSLQAVNGNLASVEDEVRHMRQEMRGVHQQIRGVAQRLDSNVSRLDTRLGAVEARLHELMAQVPEAVIEAIQQRFQGRPPEEQLLMLQQLVAAHNGEDVVAAAGSADAVSQCAICMEDVREEDDKGILCSRLAHALHVDCCQGECVVEWSGVEWSGVEWSGVEWSGVESRTH